MSDSLNIVPILFKGIGDMRYGQSHGANHMTMYTGLRKFFGNIEKLVKRYLGEIINIDKELN